MPVSLVKSCTLAIRRPGSWARFQQYPIRKNYHTIKRILLKPFLAHRQELYKNYKNMETSISIPQHKGYVMYGPEVTNRISPKLIEWCETKAKEKIKNLDLSKDHNKNYLINLLEDEELDADNEAFRFSTHPEIVSCVTKYLDAYPLLTYIGLWYTPAYQQTMMTGSQLFHLDHEDFKQVKAFVYLNDMTKDSGVQMVVDADKSLDLQREIKYKMEGDSKRVPDEVVKKCNPHQLDADKGSLVFMDTSSCFHAGGRTQNQDRLLLTFQYVTPYRHAKTKHIRKYEDFSAKLDNVNLKRLLKI